MAKPNCLACGEPSISRGLCGNCYSSANQRVRTGQTTWEEIEAMGLCLTARARNAPNAWAKLFAEAIDKK